MLTDSILVQIDAEIVRLQKVRALLANVGKVSVAGTSTKTKTAKPHKRRTLSAEARKRIADAQRRRWAAQKSKSK